MSFSRRIKLNFALCISVLFFHRWWHFQRNLSSSQHLFFTSLEKHVQVNFNLAFLAVDQAGNRGQHLSHVKIGEEQRDPICISQKTFTAGQFCALSYSCSQFIVADAKCPRMLALKEHPEDFAACLAISIQSARLRGRLRRPHPRSVRILLFDYSQSSSWPVSSQTLYSRLQKHCTQSSDAAWLWWCPHTSFALDPQMPSCSANHRHHQY